MDIRIIRSQRRKRTVQAKEVNGVIEVRVPADMSDEELAPIVEKLTGRLQKRKARNALDDDALQARAELLNRRYFDGRLRWRSIQWVTNQTQRFGSCTPSRGTIRLSHRLGTMPRFVQDYVIVHELAHLEEANHGPDFWALVNRYPLTERARGYLMAVGLEESEEE
ncbi:MAG: M48 family metallopeptidase [Caldilineaceae bacterium]|nr:M48 family metallopeptidase [Caldilineaceae bacterium]